MDSRKKMLVILSPGFPKDEADTAWLPPQQVFVRALKAKYPDLNIVVLSFQYPHHAAEYDWFGVKVIALGGQGKGGFYRRKIWATAWIKLLQLNRKHQIIGLLSFWLDECALIAHRLATFKNIRHRCWLLGQDAKAGNRYVKRLSLMGDELIALSDFVARTFNKNYGVTPAAVIPVGIDTAMFKPTGDKRDIDIIGAGSLIPLKRFHLFVELVKRLKQNHPHIKTVICGDGPERENIQQLIVSNDLSDNIWLTGEQPHEAVITMMQRSRILFHPSKYEGFGTVTIEALYAGAGVISFVKPMDRGIPNWYIVNDIKEAEHQAQDLLRNTHHNFKPVLAFDIRDNVKKMMELFAD